MDSKKNVNYI